jgi:hypothetical protein
MILLLRQKSKTDSFENYQTKSFRNSKNLGIFKIQNNQ